jgi:hypothetical protein
MPDPHPGDIVGEANDALKGIGDLLVCMQQRNLHQVDPQNLYALVSIICARLDQAEDMLNRVA